MTYDKIFKVIWNNKKVIYSVPFTIHPIQNCTLDYHVKLNKKCIIILVSGLA